MLPVLYYIDRKKKCIKNFNAVELHASMQHMHMCMVVFPIANLVTTYVQGGLGHII